jgi:hypothetical protein
MSTRRTSAGDFTRPVRPSTEMAENAAAATAAKLMVDEGRLSIRMDRAHVRAIHIAALQAGKSVKAFVYDACRAAGAVLPDDVGEGT